MLIIMRITGDEQEIAVIGVEQRLLEVEDLIIEDATSFAEDLETKRLVANVVSDSFNDALGEFDGASVPLCVRFQVSDALDLEYQVEEFRRD